MMQFGMPFLLEMPTIADAAQLCCDLRLDFLELNASFPACRLNRLSPNMLNTLSQACSMFFTLHLHEDCDPFSFEPAVRRAWMDHVRAAIDLAKAAHMPTLNMHLPRGVHVTLPERKVFIYEQYRDEFMANLADFVRMAEDAIGVSGVRICIENTSGWKLHERQALDVLLASPVFGLTLDIGHCHGAENADEDFFLAHLNRLHHMHAHDAIGKRDHQPLGNGEIDLKSRFALAKAANARIVLETKTIAALTESVRKLEKFL